MKRMLFLLLASSSPVMGQVSIASHANTLEVGTILSPRFDLVFQNRTYQGKYLWKVFLKPTFENSGKPQPFRQRLIKCTLEISDPRVMANAANAIKEGSKLSLTGEVTTKVKDVSIISFGTGTGSYANIYSFPLETEKKKIPMVLTCESEVSNTEIHAALRYVLVADITNYFDVYLPATNYLE